LKFEGIDKNRAHPRAVKFADYDEYNKENLVDKTKLKTK